MSVSVCPIATVHASVEQVWSFLSEPANYALWWDAQTRAVTPEGRAHVGQKIRAQTTGLGRKWDVNVLVQGMDESKRQIDLKTSLPLGITVFNHITCTPIDPANSRITFG